MQIEDVYMYNNLCLTCWTRQELQIDMCSCCHQSSVITESGSFWHQSKLTRCASEVCEKLSMMTREHQLQSRIQNEGSLDWADLTL